MRQPRAHVLSLTPIMTIRPFPADHVPTGEQHRLLPESRQTWTCPAAPSRGALSGKSLTLLTDRLPLNALAFMELPGEGWLLMLR